MNVPLEPYRDFESNRSMPITNPQSTAYFGVRLGDNLYTDKGCASYDRSQTAFSFSSNSYSLGQDSSEQALRT